MWVARDKDGELYLYQEKPSKSKFFWNTNKGVSIFIDGTDFPYLEVMKSQQKLN